MIGSFRDKALEAFCYEGSARRIPADLQAVIRRKVDMLDIATDLNDLRVPPANHLEALGGDRKGCHSIRVNRRWRVVFRWREGAAHDIEFVDYH